MDENDIIKLLTNQAISIGQECLSINAAIDELFIGASNATGDRKAGFNTALFELLGDRRDFLREELVRIDKEIKNFQESIAKGSSPEPIIDLDSVEPGDTLLFTNDGQAFGGDVVADRLGALWAGATLIRSSDGKWLLSPNIVYLHEKGKQNV